MLRRQAIFAVLCGVPYVTCSAGPSNAALTAEQEVHSVTGTYQCVVRQSNGSTLRFSSVNDAFGAWLRVHVTYPPQKGLAAGDKAIVFVGYDADAKRWNIVSIDADGSYYSRSSRSAHFDESRWQDEYPRDGGKAVIRTYGSTRYTFDLTMPSAKGGSIRTGVICTRT